MRWATVPSFGGERDEVHAVEFVAQVAPGVAGFGFGDAEQQQRQPAELDVRFDAALAAVVGGGACRSCA